MDYEKKYKEALGWMQSLYKGLHGKTKEEAEHFFPELKESEDERIKKTIIRILKGETGYISKEDTDRYIAWLEKQGEKKHFSNFKAKDWYVSTVDGKIYNMTYNPTDKIEPKFKVGDWISGYYTNYKVLSVNDKGYVVEDTNGNKINILFENEKFHHLFTIADARNGDVLVHNGYPFIFMGVKDGIVQALEENLLEGTNPVNFGEPKIDKNYQPATKEQCDLLFQKMKEAGYEWDAEKKELKKIEPKKLDADKVIEWLKNNGWCTVCGPKVERAQINKFKKDFGL